MPAVAAVVACKSCPSSSLMVGTVQVVVVVVSSNPSLAVSMAAAADTGCVCAQSSTSPPPPPGTLSLFLSISSLSSLVLIIRNATLPTYRPEVCFQATLGIDPQEDVPPLDDSMLLIPTQNRQYDHNSEEVSHTIVAPATTSSARTTTRSCCRQPRQRRGHQLRTSPAGTSYCTRPPDIQQMLTIGKSDFSSHCGKQTPTTASLA